MVSLPDYKNYTIYELLEAKSSIDTEKYSDRLLLIENEISERLKIPEIREEILLKQEAIKYETFWPRLFASMVDGVFIAIISIFILSLSSLASGDFRLFFGYLDDVQFVIYSVYLHGMYGKTFGKMVLGLKVVNFSNEDNIGFKQAMLRDCVPLLMLLLVTLSYIFSPLDSTGEYPGWMMSLITAFGVVYFIWYFLEVVTMLFNKKNRALHDIIAGTIVIKD